MFYRTKAVPARRGAAEHSSRQRLFHRFRYGKFELVQFLEYGFIDPEQEIPALGRHQVVWCAFRTIAKMGSESTAGFDIELTEKEEAAIYEAPRELIVNPSRLLVAATSFSANSAIT